MKACPLCDLRYPDEVSSCFVDGSSLAAVRDARLGTTLAGRYLLEEVIGEGGMATVYRARQKSVDRSCAVKVMHNPLKHDDVRRERFRREAKAAKRLAHPNVIEIFDQGYTDDDTPYLVMELLKGQDLSRLLQQGRLSLERALPILAQVIGALSRAHDFGVLHRDLKPENIFLCTAISNTLTVKLLDFGLARSHFESRLTKAGEVFGTPAYMAPERLTNREAGASADLYSFGIILFETVTGQLPFKASDVPSLFAQHLRDQAPSCRDFVPTLPISLERLIAQLLKKEPEQRPSDAHRVRFDINALCEEQSITLIPEEPFNERSKTNELAHKLQSAPSSERWVELILLLKRIIAQGFGELVPEEILTRFRQLEGLRDEFLLLSQCRARERTALTALESTERNRRMSLGAAMDGLGQDASKARDDARRRKDEVAYWRNDFARHAEAFGNAHRSVLQWEGRCAMVKPCRELAAAYRAAAEEMDVWNEALKAGDREKAALNQKRQEISDLEFQIEQLRQALIAFEQASEKEKNDQEQHVLALNLRAETLETEMTFLLERCCDLARSQQGLEDLFIEWEQLTDERTSGDTSPQNHPLV